MKRNFAYLLLISTLLLAGCAAPSVQSSELAYQSDMDPAYGVIDLYNIRLPYSFVGDPLDEVDMNVTEATCEFTPGDEDKIQSVKGWPKTVTYKFSNIEAFGRWIIPCSYLLAYYRDLQAGVGGYCNGPAASAALISVVERHATKWSKDEPWRSESAEPSVDLANGFCKSSYDVLKRGGVHGWAGQGCFEMRPWYTPMPMGPAISSRNHKTDWCERYIDVPSYFRANAGHGAAAVITVSTAPEWRWLLHDRHGSSLKPDAWTENQRAYLLGIYDKLMREHPIPANLTKCLQCSDYFPANGGAFDDSHLR